MRAELDLGELQAHVYDQTVNITASCNGLVPLRVPIAAEALAAADDVLQMTLPVAPPLERCQAVQHRLRRSLLQVEVERRINSQAAFVHLVRTIFLFQIAAYFFDKIWRRRVFRLNTQAQRRGFRAAGLFCGDLAVFKHVVDHQIAALECAIRISDRRIEHRSLGQSRQERGFFQL